MTTGSRMKARRKELGVPVDEIASTLGVSIATVYRYESGDIEKVPGFVLEPLSKVLRTTPAYLMGWDDDPDEEADAVLREIAKDAVYNREFYNLPENDKIRALASLKNSTAPTIDEMQLVGLYKSLNEQGQKKLLEYAADLMASGLYANSKTGSISEKYAAFQTTNIRDQIDVAAAGGIDIPLETAESGSTANEPEDLP